MRINNNLMAMNTGRQLGINTTNGAKSMEKLSSGMRINRAADDAAGLSISEKMRGQIRGLQQASKNAQDGISFIQTAEGALNEVSSMLVRMKELAVQDLNGTYSGDDKTNLQLELTALTAEINNIVTNTKFNGMTAIGGQVSIQIDDSNASYQVGIASYTVVANSSLATIEASITATNTARSTLGAQQNRLEHAYNNLGTTAENLQAAESRIRDTDMAKEMMEQTKNSILAQAATAMMSQANQQPQTVLQLLR